MKRAYFIVGLITWFSSLTIAFIVGRSNVERSVTVADIQIERRADMLSSTVDTEQITSDALSVVESPPADAFAAYFEGSETTLSKALAQLDRLSPGQARNFLDEAFALPSSDPQRSRLITSLLEQLAATNPDEAYALTANIASLRDAERAKIAVLEVWAKSDPVGALAWAQTALVDEPRHLYTSQMQALYRGYAELNPEAAFASAQALPAETRAESRLRDRLMSEVIETQVREGNVEQANLAIQLIDDPEVRERMTEELVNEWAQYDPESAAAYVTALGEGASTRVKSELADEWAESDPAAAAAWLLSLEEGDPAVVRAASDVIREWSRYDLTASAEWLNSLPASPELDRAVASYTFRAAQEDPANAMTWAESISNDWVRTRLMTSVAGTWKNEDSQAFETYVESAELSDEQKEQLRNAEERGFGGGRPPFGRR
ncbi:MAG: hypothetical protein ACON4O_00475 [Lentimonas sp.]